MRRVFTSKSPILSPKGTQPNETQRLAEIERIQKEVIPLHVLNLKNVTLDELTLELVNQTYHKIALMIHPDKTNAPETSAAFAKLKEATNILRFMVTPNEGEMSA